MTSSDVTVHGLVGQRPARDAAPGGSVRRRTGGEQPMVPEAEFRSYYGLPVLKQPVWHAPDIPGYLFAGGLAAGSSLLGAGAQLRSLDALATRSKVVAAVAAAASGVALVHDLGKPSRFVNMLRVFKPTSPMSVGSWLLAGFGPSAGLSALSAVTNRLTRTGAAATAAAAGLAPLVASYTGALLSDTAIPVWHAAYRELPVVFVGSAAMAAGGMGMVVAPASQSAAARHMAAIGWAIEAASSQLMEHRLGMLAEPYEQGRAARWFRAGKVLGLVGAAGAVFGRRSRVGNALSGAALVSASVCTRFGVFHAGFDSANDPKYTILPQQQARSGRR